MRVLQSGNTHGARGPHPEKLTQREQGILRYLATDLSHAEIAEAEFISVNTVKTHTAHVYQKLGVVNRRAAVRRSAELGLL